MRKNSKKKITGAFFGTIVEYYDYSLYGFSAGILAEKFFPGTDKVSSLMYVFAIYALSYLAKPFGAIFFSKIGDKYGRIISLKLTIFGIAIPTVIIGLLPENQHIGSTITLILVFCRFFQGFFTAGEYDGAAIYVIEHMDQKHNYTASAITRGAGVAGLLLGIASTNFFNSSIFPEWCWRIPFLLSLPLVGITLYYRKFLEETPDFVKSQNNTVPFSNIIIFIKTQWKLLLIVTMLAGGFGVTYQIAIIFMKHYLLLVIPGASNIMSSFSVIIVLVFGITMPIAGVLADRFGRELILNTSLLLVLISCVVLIAAIKMQLLNLALIGCLLLAIAVSPFNALSHAVLIRAFKVNERYRGIGLGHTTGSVLMSGTASYICLLFIKKYNIIFFPIIYIALFAIIAYLMIRILDKNKDTHEI
ncbi:MAG: MFS transporter [Rickettsiaceae bacterium]